MLQMFKRDFYLNGIFIIMTFLFVPFIYVMNMDSMLILYISVAAIHGFIFNTFYYDSNNHVNRFIVSLPFKINNIVLSRYLFFLVTNIIFLLYLWIINTLAYNNLPYIVNKPFTIETFLIMFTLVVVLMSISVPVYYFFQSYTKALIIQMLLLFITAIAFGILSGNYSPEETFTTLQEMIMIHHVLIAITVSIIVYFFSFKLSSWIFAKKDII